ncbi:hypothetical protein [Streptomyces sp. cg35]|uniref:hypothetical protein n=1 Tax=Streptomyces sp. cg35 TaxID=3421650 RepID=UPI003D17CEAA
MIDACWPLLAIVRATTTEVVWSGFYPPQRPERGELPPGPYVFSRPACDETLAAPVPLPQALSPRRWVSDSYQEVARRHRPFSRRRLIQDP